MDETELCIVWHPRRMSGRPTIGHSRFTADTMAGCVAAGDTVQSVADNYDIVPEQVRLACWFVATHDRDRARWKQRARKQWTDWARAWQQAVWWDEPHPNYPLPGDPPRLTGV